MGSSKKADKASKHPTPKGDVVVAQLVEEIRRQRDELVESAELLRAVIEWNAAVQRQLDAVLIGQRRTNSLLELALGSALDAELEAPNAGG